MFLPPPITLFFYIPTRVPPRCLCTQATHKIARIRCLFGPLGALETENQLPVITNATAVSLQIIVCKHPPAQLRAGLLGKTVTLVIDSKVMNSTATYQPVPKPVPAAERKTYCACLLLWYRAEFLLEWLWYHTSVHGLQKVFIYDNDSEIDDLQGMVRWLRNIFDIELVPWHTHKTQLAYHGHCAVSAAPQCEWVSFTDVDEFVRLGPTVPNEHRAVLPEGDRLRHFLGRVPKNMGGIEMPMITMSAGNTSLIRKPPGGVVRNYECHGRGTNVKSVVRPNALHHSLVNMVHQYTYKAGYKVERYLLSDLGPKLLHYKNQAWEVHMRKYMRRASPATSPFKVPGGGLPQIDEPPAKWVKEVNSTCVRVTRAAAQTLWCGATRIIPTGRASCAEAGSPAVEHQTRLSAVIVGTGGIGSGSQWLRRQARAFTGDGERVQFLMPQQVLRLRADSSVFVDGENIAPAACNSSDVVNGTIVR